MAIDKLMKELNLDRYDRNARLRPALFTILPPMLLLAIWYPKVWTLFGALVSLLVSCGATFLLAQLARQRGRDLETRWHPDIGKAHSTVMLSHADTTIPTPTKQRYHAFLKSKGLEIPSPQQEARDREKARMLYRSAIDWMLEYTRKRAEKTLLLDENIAYGFRRNLYGLKPLALAILALTIALDGVLTWRIGPASPAFIPGIVLGLGLIATGAVWLLSINKGFVRDASTAYAQRLFAQCDVPAATRKSG